MGLWAWPVTQDNSDHSRPASASGLLGAAYRPGWALDTWPEGVQRRLRPNRGPAPKGLQEVWAEPACVHVWVPVYVYWAGLLGPVQWG